MKIFKTGINLQQSIKKIKKINFLVQELIKTEPALVSWQNLRGERERNPKPQMVNKDGDSEKNLFICKPSTEATSVFC